MAVIDDAHLLDDPSLAVVLHLAQAQSVPVVLSVRSGEPVHPDLVDLWTSGALPRIDLQPLDPAAVAELVAMTAGASPSANLVDRLVGETGGNPLLIRELVLDGVDNGGIVLRGGRAELVELRPGRRIADVTSARLAP